MKTEYTEDYFKSNNYINYLSKQDRYIKTAEEIYTTFNKFGIIDQKTKILDYGCSVGFLMTGFRQLGCNSIYGYDISEWAVQQATDKGCNILLDPAGDYNLGIFLDVLEHMTDEEIIELFNKITVDKILVRIPCATPLNPGQFHLEVSQKDPTHINCKTNEEWISFFAKLGYSKLLRINMSTVYDSPGCFCAIFI
jgi:hypothetical protein